MPINFSLAKFLILLFFITNTYFSFAQTELVITNIEEKEKKLIVTYDILRFKKEDLFDVYVQIITPSGNIIKPKNVTGDTNKKLPGKNGYKITWDLAADSIFINEDIEIQIGANVSLDISYLKYSSLMLSSTLLPGAGLSKIEKKKSYFLMSVLGYCGLGASVYFYSQAYQSQTNYENEFDPVKRDELKRLTKQNIENAKIAGISTAGIWLINYIWFTSKWRKKKKETASTFNKGLNFYANYNPNLKKPMFTLVYKF